MSVVFMLLNIVKDCVHMLTDGSTHINLIHKASRIHN